MSVREVQSQVDQQAVEATGAMCEMQDSGVEQTRPQNEGRQGTFGYVYVLLGRVGKFVHFVKIGKTLDPATRIDGIASTYDKLQPALPFRIEIGPVFKCWIGNEGYAEKWLHERFSDIRLRGEWFQYTKELMEFFQQDALDMPFPVTIWESRPNPLKGLEY